MKTNKTLILIAVIIVLGFIAYINVYNNQFLWDDEFNIIRNQNIQSFSGLKNTFTSFGGSGAGRADNFYRPIKFLSYTFIYKIFGLTPWPFHLLNIILHTTNAVLLFLLFKKLFKKNFIAFFTSVLWLVHPIHTEAVAYTSATQDPFAIFFMLLAFIFYLKQNKLFWLSSLFFMLGLLSKESIIIFPGLLLMYELFLNKNRNLKKLIPCFAISIIYFILRLTILNFGGSLNMYSGSNIYTQNIFVRIFTFLAALIKYYSFLIFPSGLHMERSFPVFTSFFNFQIIFSILILIGLGLIIYCKSSKYAFAICWFFIAFIPMSGIIPVNSLLLEHWLYLPSIGFFLFFTFLINKLKYKYFVLILILILIILTLCQNTIWKEPVTLYENILKYEQGTGRVHNNLAMAYADKNNLAKAEENYLEAIRINDIYAETHYNLARLYLSAGYLEPALQHLEKSLEINSNFFYSYNLLGQIYENQGDMQKAQEYYDKAKNIKFY